MAENFFDDEDYQDALVSLLCRDIVSLRAVADMLRPDDFKPLRGMKHGRARWTVAEVVLDHYAKYREPLGKLLRSSVLAYAEASGFGSDQLNELKVYCNLVSKSIVTAPTPIIEKAVKFKRGKAIAAALDEMTDLHHAGQLTEEKWYEISHKALGKDYLELSKLSDYLTTLPERLTRRSKRDMTRRPWTLIDPLDHLVRGLGPGEVGMGLAPRKRGKSLFLQWLAIAYTFQHLNVVLFTLETPRPVVEDRMDSIVTSLPIKQIGEMPIATQKRFQKWRAMVNSHLHIYDGTQGGVTIPRVEQVVMEQRERGFPVDAVIIDYDDEITPVEKNKDRRFEFASIYRDMRQMTGRHNLICWTAAQTQRDTESLKILSGSKVAEDISKINKVALCISLGKGDWEDGNSIYLWVAAANNEAMDVGAHIIPDKKRMLIYDREATARAARIHGKSS